MVELCRDVTGRVVGGYRRRDVHDAGGLVASAEIAFPAAPACECIAVSRNRGNRFPERFAVRDVNFAGPGFGTIVVARTGEDMTAGTDRLDDLATLYQHEQGRPNNTGTHPHSVSSC